MCSVFQALCALLVWTSSASAGCVSLRSDPQNAGCEAFCLSLHSKRGDPACDPEDPAFDPKACKCKCECEEKEEEAPPPKEDGPPPEKPPPDPMGNGEDDMAEEMADVDNGPQFEEFDVNGDDKIDMNEAASYGVTNGIPMEEVDSVFKYLDADSDGSITREEWGKEKAKEATEDMAPTLSDLDLNGDGVIEYGEWEMGCVCGKTYLDTCASEDMCADLFESADTNFDKILDKAEFDGAGANCESADDGNCELLASSQPSDVEHSKKPSIPLRKFLRVKVSGHNLFAFAKQRARKFGKAHQKVKQGKPSKSHQRKQVTTPRHRFPKKVGHQQRLRQDKARRRKNLINRQ